jgi:Ca-activated chloride channel family protein
MKRYIYKFRMNKMIVLTSLCLLCFIQVFAQSERKEIRKGNEEYKAGKYPEAELSYRKALEKNNKSTVGTYNLGDALYRQKKYEEAADQYKNNAEIPGNGKEQKSNSNFNLGNALLKAEKYEESIEAYKKALKSNPKDEDARYNLAYAQSKLLQQQQQQQQDKNNKDNKDNKDQKKNQQQQQQQDKKEQDKKDQQQQQQDQAENKKNEEKRQEGKPPKISKEDAERMLEALKNDEKNLQKKMAKKEGVRGKVDKDW